MNTSTPPIIVPLASADASLEVVGGKGRSLAELTAAGLPVPAGFVLTARAYEDFEEANELHDRIREIVVDVTPHEVASAESGSARIQSLFEAGPLPNEMAASVGQAYAALGEGEPAVAVRSSATAEDLPGSSFAGQQDTYLNVRGEAAVLEAIRRCWASLWTARAFGYREQMHIDQWAVAMGVVVQLMVDADVSGILFTANPATGDRSELLINASFGLGEGVVGGRVTPDTYILDRTSLEAKATVIGAKAEMIVAAGEQGTTTQPVPEPQRGEQSLSAAALRELASLGVNAERLFDGLPQDIEWVVADGKWWLLQSRPITKLPPAPLRDVSWDPPSKGAKLIRRQVVENMPDPLSALFAELYLEQGLDQSIDRLLADFGLPFKIEDFIERPMFVTVNGFAYCRADYRVSWRVVPRVLYWYVTSLRKRSRNLVPHWRDQALPGYLATIDHWKAMDSASVSDEQWLWGVRALAVADAGYWFDVAIVIGAAKVTDALLNRLLASRAVKGNLTSGVFLRGFPSKTLQAQEDLEAIARRVRATEALRDRVVAAPAGELLDLLGREPAGHSLLADIEQYLGEYGHQIYTLDFVQPTQAEDPLPVLLTLRALVENACNDISRSPGGDGTRA